MDFYAVLDQVLDLLRQRGRVTYNALKRQFELDDACLQDLKDEIIEAQRLAVDENDRVLVWTGDVATPPLPASAPVSLLVRQLDAGLQTYTPAHLTEKILTARAALTGERKQVTVLFADLKDSTELIRGLDPEAAQQILDPALHLMMDAVHRFEGTVNQVLGDGIMALFGAPIAHEDHALRACYAALAMQAAMRAYTEEVRRTRGLELRMRVGLNSGEVVVRAIGNDLHMDYSAVGETTVLAARMEQTATPGSSRLTVATLRLVEGLVQVMALGLVPVKGLEEPVEVFELVGASRVRRRLQAAAVRGLTAFVGRQPELEAIHQALAQAQDGHGQGVAMVGEAGVGKSRLAHLQAAEFLYETRLFPEPEYTFKHALTHEVGYNSLLLERRRVLHARTVETLERFAPGSVAEQVEHLAHHALRGEAWAKALAYCRQAGEKAMARSAHREAGGYFEQALSVLPHLPEQRDTGEQAIDLRLALHRVYLPLLELARVFERLREAETLAEGLGDRWRLGRVSALMTQYLTIIGDHALALVFGQRAVAIASDLGDFSLQVEAHQWLGVVYHARGDYRPAMECFGRNVASVTGDLLWKRFNLGGVASVQCRAWLVWCLAEQGRFAESAAHHAEAMRIAEAVDHPTTLLHAHFGGGFASLRQGDLHQAIPTLKRGLDLCQTWHIPAFFARFAAALGTAYALSGQSVEALPLLVQAVANDDVTGHLTSHALWMAHLGEAYLGVSRLDDAMQLAGRALEYSRAHNERGHEAWALRLLGEIAARRTPPDVAPAEAHYQQALALAKELGMRPLVAHCHHGLGRLYGQTGRTEQARTALATAIDLYRAMDMTFWLPQAEAALAQVA